MAAATLTSDTPKSDDIDAIQQQMQNTSLNLPQQTTTDAGLQNEETKQPLDAPTKPMEQPLQSNQSNVNTMNSASSMSDDQSMIDKTNLIINYLPPTMSEGTLATLFSPYGSLERCKIVVDLHTLRSRGYGFVKYDNPVSAERALSALNGYELNGKRLKVAFARKQSKDIQNANLYITNIPLHYSDNDLYKLFAEFGQIIECRVLMDQHGKSRGVGFVRMDTHHHAIAAIQARDQFVCEDNHPPLSVKLAQRRVPRRHFNGGPNPNQRPSPSNLGPDLDSPGPNVKKLKNKRNAPKKYYPKHNQPTAAMGANMENMPSPMGPNTMSRSPGKRYYRPRQQNQSKPQYQQRNRGPQGGAPPYFPPPIYDTGAYPMGQYGQYHPNMHMPASVNPNQPNPSGLNQAPNYYPQ
jgi:RNA recognition motif-containing protein